MQMSYLTHYYLRKYRQKKDYVLENKFVCFLLIINFIFWALLLTGNLSLGGLKLHGNIKSTGKHCHNKYDHSFVMGVDKDNVKQGTGIEATNIRGTSVSGGYLMSEGVLYIHGPIMFAESVEYPPKKDKSGKFILDENGNTIPDVLGIPLFKSSGRVGAYPDYTNNSIMISGLKLTTVQLTELANDIKPYLEKGNMICGD